MAAETDNAAQGETQITVRYWASARAAAGVNEERLDVDGPISLAEVRRRALALHPDSETLERVIGACSVLLDDEPVGKLDPDRVRVHPGRSVEFLPPFAGG
ncbi:MAG: MoaD/ThiS family protein [Nocardioides sp.]|nr:MoaD/ThiS family protein [Nocardioides sp.]